MYLQDIRRDAEAKAELADLIEETAGEAISELEQVRSDAEEKASSMRDHIHHLKALEEDMDEVDNLQEKGLELGLSL